MFNYIIVGQYIPTNSFLHRLDVRTKIMAIMVYIICVFYADNWLKYLFLLTTIIGVYLVAKIPLTVILKSWLPVSVFAFFTFLLHALFTNTGQKLFSLWSLTIYSGGLQQGTFMFMRILLLVSASNILTLSTVSIEIVNGIEFFLAPLKYVKVPVGQFALMIAIALRFIPTLLQEADKISKAQMSRGASFTAKSLNKKIVGVVSLFVPLFIHAFKYAEDLAQAMEVRGYQPEFSGRTKFRKLEMKIYDYLCLLGTFFYVIFFLKLF